MTWGSYGTTALRTLLIVPIVLRQFDASDIAVWYLLATITSLQMLADVGFAPTFIRAIGYAMAGTTVDDLHTSHAKDGGTPNWSTVRAIYGTMGRTYSRLSLLYALALGLLGTLVLHRTIVQTDDPAGAWSAWVVTLLVTTATLRGNSYAAFLQGTNHVALLRRWEMVFGFCSIASSLVVLLLHGSLLQLVIASQAWQVVAIARNAWLTRKIARGRFELRDAPASKQVLAVVWPSAWRSAVGMAMSYGLVAASGMIYAQFGQVAEVAAYLFALRLYQMLRDFAMAPFYSGLPEYARLFAERKTTELVRRAQVGMFRAHCAFVAGLITIGALGPTALATIGANIQFPPLVLWAVMGLGFWFERYGAMHIQLYSTTNRIIWHVANGVSGVLCTLVTLLLATRVGVYAFPLGLLAGNVGFYSWYTALHSYDAFGLRFPRFELRAALPAFVAASAFLIVALYVA